VTDTDGLGRLAAVWEDPGSSPHFNYETTYRYDVLDDLTQVAQGNETRAFSYDSLKRLSAASNPESGTTSYTYDGVGNLLAKTDGRGTKTSYSYDALNRVTQKVYSDGTAAVSYQYDAAGAGYSWGRLTQVSNGNATTNYTSIDPLGQVTASNQVTGGQTYGFTYAYNLTGALTQETYPSGRVVSTAYNNLNWENGVTGSYNGAGTAYVGNVSYWPHGAPEGYQYGNNVWRGDSFNSRLQSSCLSDTIGLSTSAYLLVECSLNWGATNDNGNLLGMTLQAGGPGTLSALPSFGETFNYDSLNRLTSAADTGGWSRSFAYDQYGNGWVTGWTGMGLNVATPVGNIYNGKNQIGSSPYDAAGNMTALPPGMTFTYDAENRQATETNTGGLSATYLYDGDGKRVEKLLNNGQKVVYVYDALGKLAAEYDLQTSETPPPCATCYLSYDHLGSLRMVTDQNANVVGRHDYIPSGEEIPGGIAGRSGQFGSSDSVSQKFTGKERDTETSLDYFGARYYGAGMGRWMSADPAKISFKHLTNPQKWNKYAYTINNPMRYFDPNGSEEIDVQFRAFIEQKTVSDPIGRQFAGDNRSFTSAQNVSSRTSITVRIETDPNIRPNSPIISVTQPGIAGPTHQVDANGNVLAQKTATTGLPTVVGGRDADGNATLSFRQNTKNPLEPQALTPGISANLNVTVAQSGSWADVTGNMSLSPSFEMNFGSTNVPLNSELQGPAFGLGLIAPNTSVNQFVLLPPPPPPLPACANESGHCQ
jgi:RHS repeat-associated protein